MSNSVADLIACGTTEIFLALPDWTTPPTLDLSFGREVIQYDEAVTRFRYLTSDLEWKSGGVFSNFFKTEEYYILDFFFRHMGRLKKFWLPVQSQYFKLATNIGNGATVFTLDDDTFQYVYRGYERLYMLLSSGDMITRKISSSHGSGEYSVATAFDRAINKNNVVLFGKLALVRFDQDEIEMQHDTPEVSTCELSFKELPKEYA